MDELKNIIEKCIGDELPFCQAACPLHVDMKGANVLIRDGRFDEALKKIIEKLPFPGTLGRICTHPCEEKCRRKDVDESISIRCLKRSAADYGETELDLTIDEEKDKKTAVIGGGPAGLMAAYDLRKKGYQVTIFEALPELGGMMTVIPDFRLPTVILKNEISVIERLGIKVELNSKVGKDASFTDIVDEYDAVFIAVGTHKGRGLGIENSYVKGVVDGIEFLRMAKSGKLTQGGQKAIIVGGGNVAVDCGRTCIRLGFKDVTIVYRRSWVEMPAIEEEVIQAEREGLRIEYRVSPIKVLTNQGKATGIHCVRTELGEPDESGRRRPIPVAGSEFDIEADLIIGAVGEQPELDFLTGEAESIITGSLIEADPLTLGTGIKGVFAGGDAVTGSASVIDALAAGRKAAISIDRYLRGENIEVDREGEGPVESRLKVSIEGITRADRIEQPTLPDSQRRTTFHEVDLGLSKEDAIEEAKCCLECECQLCVKDCEFLKQYCRTPKELAMKIEEGYFKENPVVPYSCNLCELCRKLCPEDLCIGDMCLAMREKMVAEGAGPLPEQELVVKDQDWSTSDAFAGSLPYPGNQKGDWAFFPGCSLCAYSPELVMKVYGYLKERVLGTGIILNCCGAPTHCLGDRARFSQIKNNLESEVKKLGASGVLLACPECIRTIKRSSPGLKVKPVYELILEEGLPEGAKASTDYTFSLHDSCTAREENELMDSIRELAKKMGYNIEEMEYSRDKTRCCGAGGMIPYVDLGLYLQLADQRAGEAPFDMLTYCATCRDTFASVGKPVVHILDLIFNSDWQNNLLKSPEIGKSRREKQAEMKSLLVESEKR